MEDQEIINEFLIESNENLGRLDQEMVELEKRPQDSELLASVFRTFHTIKGTCGFLGYSRLERVAHQAESVLSQLRSGSLALTSDLASLILAAMDVLRRHMAAIEATGQEAADDSTDLCQRLEKAVRGDGSAPAASPARLRDAEGATAQKAGVADSAIRVDVHLLDKLMNLVGELVLARNQILQFTAQQEGAALGATSQRLNLITSELQEGVMKTRMQPIGVVWNKLPRLVRDVATSCGKQIALEMEGADTELDKTIIEAIKDPLTHIVRNSGDHGIERPEVRKGRGKPGQGRICLRAFHEGGQVIIEINDDGAGVDAAKVRAKAVNNGLIRPDQAERMDERETLNLLFLPGFSTAEKVTNVSGRGVGMDVVRTNIEKIGGTVDLSTRLGEGTTVRLKIPLTLAIIPGLVVTLGDRRDGAGQGRSGDGTGEQFVIPQVNLVELVRLEGETAMRSIERIRDTAVYRLRGHLLPIVYLREVLGLEASGTSSSVVNIAVLQAEERQFGLVVDGVKDTQEIVVKPLGKHLKGLNCYAGATIMGDGRVALILDVLGIAQKSGAMTGGKDRTRSEAAAHQDSADGTRQTFLLFRAGAFERLAVPLSLVARLEEFPQSRIERSGGRLVVQYRERILPLVPLAPILEAGGADTSTSQDPLQVIVFNDGDRRIGLVVDQLVDIVDDVVAIREASSRKGLLGSVVIGKRVTNMVDLDSVIRDAFGAWKRDEEVNNGGATVMVAEGSTFSRGMLRASLEMAGYQVIEAANAAEALSQLARNRVNVVVTALDLPGGGGSEFLRKMRKEPALAGVPAVALADAAEEAPNEPGQPGWFEECLIRGDREAMLRSIRRLAGALAGQAGPATEGQAEGKVRQ
jgi:two-component system, chemotaxis family, sensor kinase CheA